jgi:Nucleotidyl transferase AbiEii toxin, Type IV TA system
LASTIREICQVEVTDDGMIFDPSTIVIEEIREDANYGGLRVKLLGKLGNSRCVLQLDIGYGDAVTPGPEEIIYPTILDDQPAPKLLIYPRATVAAEKIEAIVSLGMANSRMKDYFDLRALTREGALDSGQSAEAIIATFNRRGTPLPTGIPLGLSGEFAHDKAEQKQWKAFLNKNQLDDSTLEEAITEIRELIVEAFRLARLKT